MDKSTTISAFSTLSTLPDQQSNKEKDKKSASESFNSKTVSPASENAVSSVQSSIGMDLNFEKSFELDQGSDYASLVDRQVVKLQEAIQKTPLHIEIDDDISLSDIDDDISLSNIGITEISNYQTDKIQELNAYKEKLNIALKSWDAIDVSGSTPLDKKEYRRVFHSIQDLCSEYKHYYDKCIEDADRAIEKLKAKKNQSIDSIQEKMNSILDEIDVLEGSVEFPTDILAFKISEMQRLYKQLEIQKQEMLLFSPNDNWVKKIDKIIDGIEIAKQSFIAQREDISFQYQDLDDKQLDDFLDNVKILSIHHEVKTLEKKIKKDIEREMNYLKAEDTRAKMSVLYNHLAKIDSSTSIDSMFAEEMTEEFCDKAFLFFMLSDDVQSHIFEKYDQDHPPLIDIDGEGTLSKIDEISLIPEGGPTIDHYLSSKEMIEVQRLTCIDIISNWKETSKIDGDHLNILASHLSGQIEDDNRLLGMINSYMESIQQLIPKNNIDSLYRDPDYLHLINQLKAFDKVRNEVSERKQEALKAYQVLMENLEKTDDLSFLDDIKSHLNNIVQQEKNPPYEACDYDRLCQKFDENIKNKKMITDGIDLQTMTDTLCYILSTHDYASYMQEKNSLLVRQHVTLQRERRVTVRGGRITRFFKGLWNSLPFMKRRAVRKMQISPVIPSPKIDLSVQLLKNDIRQAFIECDGIIQEIAKFSESVDSSHKLDMRKYHISRLHTVSRRVSQAQKYIENALSLEKNQDQRTDLYGRQSILKIVQDILSYTETHSLSNDEFLQNIKKVQEILQEVYKDSDYLYNILLPSHFNGKDFTFSSFEKLKENKTMSLTEEKLSLLHDGIYNKLLHDMEFTKAELEKGYPHVLSNIILAEIGVIDIEDLPEDKLAGYLRSFNTGKRNKQLFSLQKPIKKIELSHFDKLAELFLTFEIKSKSREDLSSLAKTDLFMEMIIKNKNISLPERIQQQISLYRDRLNDPLIDFRDDLLSSTESIDIDHAIEQEIINLNKMRGTSLEVNKEEISEEALKSLNQAIKDLNKALNFRSDNIRKLQDGLKIARKQLVEFQIEREKVIRSTVETQEREALELKLDNDLKEIEHVREELRGEEQKLEEWKEKLPTQQKELEELKEELQIRIKDKMGLIINMRADFPGIDDGTLEPSDKDDERALKIYPERLSEYEKLSQELMSVEEQIQELNKESTDKKTSIMTKELKAINRLIRPFLEQKIKDKMKARKELQKMRKDYFSSYPEYVGEYLKNLKIDEDNLIKNIEELQQHIEVRKQQIEQKNKVVLAEVNALKTKKQELLDGKSQEADKEIVKMQLEEIDKIILKRERYVEPVAEQKKLKKLEKKLVSVQKARFSAEESLLDTVKVDDLTKVNFSILMKLKNINSEYDATLQNLDSISEIDSFHFSPELSISHFKKAQQEAMLQYKRMNFGTNTFGLPFFEDLENKSLLVESKIRALEISRDIRSKFVSREGELSDKTINLICNMILVNANLLKVGKDPSSRVMSDLKFTDKKPTLLQERHALELAEMIAVYIKQEKYPSEDVILKMISEKGPVNSESQYQSDDVRSGYLDFNLLKIREKLQFSLLHDQMKDLALSNKSKKIGLSQEEVNDLSHMMVNHILVSIGAMSIDHHDDIGISTKFNGKPISDVQIENAKRTLSILMDKINSKKEYDAFDIAHVIYPNDDGNRMYLYKLLNDIQAKYLETKA